MARPRSRGASTRTPCGGTWAFSLSLRGWRRCEEASLMERVTIGKGRLPSFLEALRDEYRVVAPQRVGPSDVVFDEFSAGGRVPFDYVNALLPPKSLLFPRRESLLTIKGTRKPTLVDPPEEKPLAVFGIRSCDATANQFLNRFFGERGFDDDVITGRLRGSLTMTLACHIPGPDCF